MMRYVPLFDYVIDIHSTVLGMKNCLIIEDNSDIVQKMISACGNCKTVLHMTATKGLSLFTATRVGDKIIPAIAFEYGDNSPEVTEKCFEDIYKILKALELVKSESVVSENVPDQFECYESFKKNLGDVLVNKIENYTLVRKGEVIAMSKVGEEILAPEDFYPILFGETNYTTIFGFKGIKI